MWGHIPSTEILGNEDGGCNRRKAVPATTLIHQHSQQKKGRDCCRPLPLLGGKSTRLGGTPCGFTHVGDVAGDVRVVLHHHLGAGVADQLGDLGHAETVDRCVGGKAVAVHVPSEVVYHIPTLSLHASACSGPHREPRGLSAAIR